MQYMILARALSGSVGIKMVVEVGCWETLRFFLFSVSLKSSN